jgi:putative transposase
MEYQRDEHRVHLILYHIVFCPKRRKPVLVGSVAKDVERLIRLKCEEQGWEVVALEIMPDHVHLFVRAWPTTSAAEVVKQVKGITSHELRGKYPHLLKLPSLWTRSYFASTAGNVSQEAIRRYIDSQRGK